MSATFFAPAICFSFQASLSAIFLSQAASSSLIACSFIAFSWFTAVVICVCSNLWLLSFLVSRLIKSACIWASLSFISILLWPCFISDFKASTNIFLDCISLAVIPSSIAWAFLNKAILSVALNFSLSSAWSLMSLISLFALALSTFNFLSIWCAFCLSLVTSTSASTSFNVSATKPFADKVAFINISLVAPDGSLRNFNNPLPNFVIAGIGSWKVLIIIPPKSAKASKTWPVTAPMAAIILWNFSCPASDLLKCCIKAITARAKAPIPVLIIPALMVANIRLAVGIICPNPFLTPFKETPITWKFAILSPDSLLFPFVATVWFFTCLAASFCWLDKSFKAIFSNFNSLAVLFILSLRLSIPLTQAPLGIASCFAFSLINSFSKSTITFFWISSWSLTFPNVLPQSWVSLVTLLMLLFTFITNSSAISLFFITQLLFLFVSF